MIEWIASFWESLTLGRFLLGLGLFIGSIVLNIIVIAIVFIKIPVNYFSTHYQQDFRTDTSWFKRWGVVLVKNFLGLVILLLGIVQLVGPGQGILSILTGIVLLDIPGKRPFE
ncbi:MAG: hypothetical protein LC730_01705, partial [Acidobacteria bacterium]|nr:hypothetical protein [Acidobacteriota bacterium]